MGDQSPASATVGAWDVRLERGSRNAFDLVRLALATLVVLEHSFFLLDGDVRRDPLFVLSRGQMNSGQFAVYMFFVLSGFLVTRSLQKSAGVGWYMIRRAARIIPGFVIASLFGCIVVGWLTAANPHRFLSTQDWRAIFATLLALKQVSVSGALPGNPVPLVHGTLWTIRYEFDCYILLGLLGAVGLLKGRLASMTFLGLSLLAVLGGIFSARLPTIDHGLVAMLISSPDHWPSLFPYFFVGSAFYIFRRWIPKSGGLALAGAAGTAAAIWFGGAYFAVLVLGSYILLYSAMSYGGEIFLFGRRVDVSYGVYLFGWPIQQLFIFYFGGGLSPVKLFCLSMSATLLIALTTWLLIESPCLAFAHRLEASRRARPQAIKAVSPAT